ncbi:MAG: conjugal transfer protein TraN [Rhodoferax sp.]|uniref:conjugal transfer protein TraN n=1 Tax=Rhodoferax sp. TaxID=50421 RepID=UPI001B5384CA|nr:conjugal transfer protein TraN [Rhodoferax sp.]MBP8285273.1 conjugal transfer protein TraN [Rhodoferax sp.]MBP9149068.1 conjugal transfer protein TraN [Rhodoferax sp.]MBP9736961.1 conjugal transfer protein TraN [Rhodoferax sp.]
MPYVLSAVLLSCTWPVAQAQTQTDAFNEGKTFGAGLATGATQSVNAANGVAVVPSYTNNAPESGLFGGGTGLVGSAGISKQSACTTSTAATAYLQQECEVVNYLTQMPAMRTVYPMSATDPLIANSDPVIQSPGAPGGASSAQVCRTVSQNNPGEYITETCTTARKTDFPTCTNTLAVTVNWLYTCPANTGSGPNPDANDLSLPQRNTCEVSDPYFVASCDAAADVLAITGPGTGICTDPITLVQTPATRTLQYNDYTVTADVAPEVTDNWDDQCGSLAERARANRVPYPECVEPAVKVCIQGAETRVINGLAVTRACWQWQRNFACLNPGFDANCGPRSSAKCTHSGDVCLQFTIDGKCAVTRESYSCEKTAPSVTTHQVCEPASFCQAGGSQCFSTERQPDGDFAKAAVAMETTRQGGVYGFNGTALELFKGYVESCSIKVLGGSVIKSCCGSGSGGSAFSNYRLLGAAMSVAGEAARSGTVLGSKYVYDALYQTVDSEIVNKGISAMNNWATGLGSGTFNPAFSFYGFSFSFTLANGFQFVAFDPYSFAFQIALMVITEWLSCSPPEQTMALKKGENLCVTTGSACTRKIWLIGTCLEVTETSCCFNSLLTKLINRQGHVQLGLPAQSCGGFSEAQILRLNFAAMDFSEFIQTMVPKPTDLPATASHVNQTVTQKVTDYYETP